MSRFHVQQTSLEDQRPAHEVFKSAAAPEAESFKSRFASSGKFTTEQLATGADIADATQPQPQADDDADEPEFDPNDTRSLYEKLKEQRDAKQEEWEAKHKFKNQMDHWRLDEDDAAFEEERVETLRKQQLEAQRQREEGLEFYKLARAAQERTSIPAPKTTKLTPSPFDRKPGANHPKRKGLPIPVAPVKLVKTGATSVAAAPKQSSTAASSANSELDKATHANELTAEDQPGPDAEADADAHEGGGLLPGMDEYGDDSDE
mmetsp:Transcript_48906/g.105923  ORF Transcript_48906/g.105923 Transcript_48906/m.105923 type:complete len:262 (-) Transcript_48906:131-916(-)